MDKRLYNHLHKKSRAYWFYYHLKHDSDFRKEVAELDKKLLIALPDGTAHRLVEPADFDDLEGPDKKKKLALVKEFQIRWGIERDYYLFSYLMRGDPEDVPLASGNALVALIYKEDSGMFEAQISSDAVKEDFDFLRLMFKAKKEQLGMDSSKKPRQNTFTRHKTEIAYVMWKMLRDKNTWTEVVKYIDKKYGTSYTGHIGDAKDFLNSYGYFPG